MECLSARLPGWLCNGVTCHVLPHSAVMNCHMLILETFLMTVLTRTYYRKKDDKAGYETCSPPELDSKLKA